MFMKRSKKVVSLLFILTLITSLFIGCTPKEDSSADEPKVLRIMGGYGGDDTWLRREWTDFYEITHDNVEFEFIPMQEPGKPVKEGEQPEEQEDPYERMKRLLQEGNAPDVIFLDDISQLTQLVADGLVQPLDTFMEKSKFNIENIVPAVRDGIRDAGDGNSLYALAPMFSSQALFYNKNLFEDAGVQYPTDGMTWTQIADLAKQMSKGEGDDKTYGLWSQEGANFHHFINVFSPPLGLKMFDEETMQMTMNTPEWEQVMTDYVNLAKDGVFPQPPNYDGTGQWEPWMDQYYQAFQMGKAAMAIMSSWEMNNMKNIRMYNPDAPEFDWDVVTVPVHEEAPGIGGNIQMQGIMAINRNAQNADLAWDFISYVNSDEMLKIRSRSQDQFVSRKDLIGNTTGEGPSNMAAFYTLKPAPNPFSYTAARKNENIYMLWNVGYEQMQKVMSEEITVQQALDEIQKKGQETLDMKPGEQPPVGIYK